MIGSAPPEARTGRPRILCVDDEPQILEALRDTLHRSFDVRTTSSGVEGLERLRTDPQDYALIISDMRMPVMSGSVFLREARRIAPNSTRILLTGYADLDAAVSAVNDPQLFRFLTKPCASEQLLRACAAGLGQYRLQTAERVLLEQTLDRLRAGARRGAGAGKPSRVRSQGASQSTRRARRAGDRAARPLGGRGLGSACRSRCRDAARADRREALCGWEPHGERAGDGASGPGNRGESSGTSHGSRESSRFSRVTSSRMPTAAAMVSPWARGSFGSRLITMRSARWA